MSLEVLQVLLNRVPEVRPAVLRGYRRYRLVDRCYPAVVARGPSDAVCGRLLCNLSDAEVALLNAFEDDAYDRLFVPVWPTDEARPAMVKALAYVRPNDREAELVSSWSLDAFESSADYQPYLDACRKFVGRYRDGEDASLP